MKTRIFITIPVLLLAGCATTPAERLEKHAAVISTWPAEVQTKVRAGQIAPGFTEEQVRVALGDPDRTFVRTTSKGSETVWSYHYRGGRVSFGFGIGGGGGHTSYGAGVAMSDRPHGRGPSMLVTFENGRVTVIEENKH